MSSQIHTKIYGFIDHPSRKWGLSVVFSKPPPRKKSFGEGEAIMLATQYILDLLYIMTHFYGKNHSAYYLLLIYPTYTLTG